MFSFINRILFDAAKREAFEEIMVKIDDLKKVAEIEFYFKQQPELDELMHVFIVEKWKNIPVETEEMAPKWFKIDKIPFSSMWPDDKYWLPHVLKNKFVRGFFEFDKNDQILDFKLDHEIIT
ncbi:NUDIX domain-containing protein [Candidatus Peregrinibacteria bacterium]|nr:NUDIX domain-containing protein [Candidatus Peregrinibacteria bacterium]